ncbi:MAG TPA: hypothetical protein VL523_16495 [Terriglobia bacterium]|nr:hypothetical protein [Terriglobia bacterium]
MNRQFAHWTTASFVLGAVIALPLWTRIMMAKHERQVVRASGYSPGTSKENAVASARDLAVLNLASACKILAMQAHPNQTEEGRIVDYETEDTDCSRTSYPKSPFVCTVHLKGYCEWSWQTPEEILNQPTESPQPDDSKGSVRSTIDRISRGSHQELPEARSTTAAADQGAGWDVTNNTEYQLHVYFSGPVDRELLVPAGKSRSVDMPPGTYRIAATVTNSSVDPFYGSRTLPGQTRWKSSFHIASESQ